MRTALVALVALGALVQAPAAFGQRQELAIGSPAPNLDVDSWVAGEAVSPSDGGVYIVSFWESLSTAGASEAAQRSLIRLKELQTRHGHDGLAVAVVCGDLPDRLREYVAQTKVEGVRIAADRRTASRRAWVDKTRNAKLPLTFVVGKGKLMYIGSPFDESFDAIVAKVVGGRYDPALQEQAEPLLAAARRARTVKNWRLATKHYDDVIALDPAVFAEIALERLDMMLVDMSQYDEGYAWAREALVAEKFRGDAGALRMLALRIMTDPKIPAERRDLDLALAAAQQSLELEGSDDPEALSVVAKAHYHRGELDEAIRVQTTAWFRARPEEKAAFKRQLDSYRAGAGRSGTASTGR